MAGTAMIFEPVRFIANKAWNKGDHISGNKFSLTFLKGVLLGLGYDAKVSLQGRTLYSSKASSDLLMDLSSAFNTWMAIDEDWEFQEVMAKYRRTNGQE